MTTFQQLATLRHEREPIPFEVAVEWSDPAKFARAWRRATDPAQLFAVAQPPVAVAAPLLQSLAQVVADVVDAHLLGDLGFAFTDDLTPRDGERIYDLMVDTTDADAVSFYHGALDAYRYVVDAPYRERPPLQIWWQVLRMRGGAPRAFLRRVRRALPQPTPAQIFGGGP